ncbi:Putative transcriptional regulator, AsnC family [Desulfonema limicola]|uniref:siroheme decarboxylase n=1 Tax=Desulfonema limicola TaxID=45656 RepID=A0A975GEL7_9BACT|nr:AsnC family transcriptional regulator [Desulfonema limicola]QTA78254.1 Putative transcriptional regulator, AsnC family [Desulfonema limicola]
MNELQTDNPEMDSIDREILNLIQSDFPITSRPYLEIAGKLNISEAEIISRLSRLKECGIIRRIGGNFVPHKLGFVSTLCAASVPEEKIDIFAQAVNQYPGVTHNYTRNNHFNVWFTFIAQSMNEIESNLDSIAKQTGVNDIINLPATRVFKVKAHFSL